MAMLEAFHRVLKPEQIVVAFIHHGGPSEARSQAQRVVREACEARGLRFEARVRSEGGAEDEASLRRFRREALRDIQIQNECDWIVTGHHAEDVLETRLIRLLRGTGPQGLQALQRKRSPWYRPFLELSREVLRQDLRNRGGVWIEDPTNQDARYLRNWIRQKWLPDLERQRPGASEALARSLEDVVQSLKDSKHSPVRRSYPRSRWWTLSTSEQRRVIAELLQGESVTDYTRGQLEEIRKRLDKPEVEYTFTAKACDWTVNAEQIELRRRSSTK